MKKLMLLPFVIFSANSLAASGEQTLSVGYIQVKNDGLKKVSDLYEYSSRQLTSNVANATGFPGEVKSDGYTDPQGMFMRYRYEFTDAWGIIGSVAYANYDGNTNGEVTDDSTKSSYTNRFQTKGDYVSVMGGPTWRANEYLSIYGMFGIAMKHAKAEWRESARVNNVSTLSNGGGESQSKTDAVWSVGAQVNIYKALTLDAAYEGSSGSGDWKTSGFTVGLGYKF